MYLGCASFKGCPPPPSPPLAPVPRTDLSSRSHGRILCRGGSSSQTGRAGVGTLCSGGWKHFNPAHPGSNQLTNPCSLRGSKDDRMSQRCCRCGQEQSVIRDGDVLLAIGRRLKSSLCNWKSLCFAHGGGCCCEQSSVS